jgi:hypothetical protein
LINSRKTLEVSGGSRPGSGRKLGYKLPRTLDKEAARNLLAQQVTRALMPMLRAQIAHATGIGHCYTRDKNGKFNRVEDPAKLDALLSEGTEGEHYFIFTKDPSAAAFKELLDRAIDRPKEQAQEIHVTGEIELSTRLTAARNRVIDVTIQPKNRELPAANKPDSQGK